MATLSQPEATLRASTPEIRARKAALRNEMRDRLRQLSAAERDALSRQACDRLRERPEWQQAQSILFFHPLPAELDLRPVMLEALAAGRRVALPRYLSLRGEYGAARVANPATDLVAGKLGIAEPDSTCPTVALNQLDLVLVPGLGFDLHGRRLGRGQGFYDRLLAPVRGLRCGVMLDWQSVPEIPAEPHDELLNCILTPTRWVAVAPRAV